MARFDLTTASIADINEAFDSGTLTAVGIVELYLHRIAAYDQTGPKINAVLHLNDEAVETARKLDEERATSGPRSPMHGIPVLLKDVFDTADMPTTGGYAPLDGVIPARDATVVQRLRDAGAVLLAKVNQSDWYASPDELASSTLGGTTRNPHALDRVPGWSSSGTGAGLAAHFGTVGLGSETGFSIRTPTSDSNLFGLSTTSGLISRSGQMWSYITGERGGPMAHTMYDLAVTLDVIAGFDADDLWTARSLGNMPSEQYVEFLDPDGLNGARVGVLAEAWGFTPIEPDVIDLAQATIASLPAHGAHVFDPVALGIDLPNYRDLQPANFPARPERVHAIAQYLARQGPDYPYKTPAELLLDHPSTAERADDLDAVKNPPDLDRDPAFRAALHGRQVLRDAVNALMDRFQLDALIYPHKLHGPLKIGPKSDPERDYRPNQLSPIIGFPALIVPMGFTESGLPVGLELLGRPWSEPTLIRLASGFEAVTDNRRVPSSTPPLPGERLEF